MRVVGVGRSWTRCSKPGALQCHKQSWAAAAVWEPFKLYCPEVCQLL